MIVTLVVLVSACAVGACGRAEDAAEPPRWADYLDDGERLEEVAVVSVDQAPVRIAGRRFQTKCVGEGEPHVMLVSGQGTPLENWSDIQAAIGSVARVCAYDRLGIGVSGPLTGPQTFETFAKDLDGVIEALDLRRPLVVVGHSLGAPITMTWATSHPDDAQGVVLVDPSSAAFTEWVVAPMSDEEIAVEAGPSSNPERLDQASWSSLTSLPRLGDVPLVVLTADPGNPESVAFWFPERDSDSAVAAWAEGHRQWAQFSNDSELITVEGAGHAIHFQAPEAVLAAILRVRGLPETEQPNG